MSKRMVDLKVKDGKIASINGYEVGGSGGVTYNVAVTSTTENIATQGSSPFAKWYRSNPLKANTAYEVGANVVAEFNKVFNEITINEGQIFVPVSHRTNIDDENKTLKYGDVVLVLTDVGSIMHCQPQDNQKFIPAISNLLTYTVIKAGTTGANIDLPQTGWSGVFYYMTYTLGLTETTA